MDGICVDSERAHTHTLAYDTCHTLTAHLHPCIFYIPLSRARAHLQQLLVLVGTGEGLRASERKITIIFLIKFWILTFISNQFVLCVAH